MTWIVIDSSLEESISFCVFVEKKEYLGRRKEFFNQK